MRWFTQTMWKCIGKKMHTHNWMLTHSVWNANELLIRKKQEKKNRYQLKYLRRCFHSIKLFLDYNLKKTAVVQYIDTVLNRSVSLFQFLCSENVVTCNSTFFGIHKCRTKKRVSMKQYNTRHTLSRNSLLHTNRHPKDMYSLYCTVIV